jgi:hypothetical protein
MVMEYMDHDFRSLMESMTRPFRTSEVPPLPHRAPPAPGPSRTGPLPHRAPPAPGPSRTGPLPHRAPPAPGPSAVS